MCRSKIASSLFFVAQLNGDFHNLRLHDRDMPDQLALQRIFRHDRAGQFRQLAQIMNQHAADQKIPVQQRIELDDLIRQIDHPGDMHRQAADEVVMVLRRRRIIKERLIIFREQRADNPFINRIGQRADRVLDLLRNSSLGISEAIT